MNMAEYENNMLKNNDFICRYKSDDFAYWNCNYIYKEAVLSKEQALLLTYLQKIRWLPVYRLIVLYETSHIHVQVYKNMFYVCSGTETEKEVKESEENLNYLYQLGLLKASRQKSGCTCIILWSRAIFFGRFFQNTKKSRIPGQLWKEARSCLQKKGRLPYLLIGNKRRD